MLKKKKTHQRKDTRASPRYIYDGVEGHFRKGTRMRSANGRPPFGSDTKLSRQALPLYSRPGLQAPADGPMALRPEVVVGCPTLRLLSFPCLLASHFWPRDETRWLLTKSRNRAVRSKLLVRTASGHPHKGKMRWKLTGGKTHQRKRRSEKERLARINPPWWPWEWKSNVSGCKTRFLAVVKRNFENCLSEITMGNSTESSSSRFYFRLLFSFLGGGG